MFVQLQPKYGVNYTAGQLFFTRNDRSFISNGIAYFTGKENIFKCKTHIVTHVGICTGMGQGVEMQFGGFARCDLNKYFEDTKTRIIFREPILLEEIGTALLFYFVKKWLDKGIDYDFGLIAGMVLSKSRVWGRFLPNYVKEKLLNATGSEKKRICSEAVQILCNKAGYHNEEIEKITPQELFSAKWLKPLKTTLNEKNDDLVIEGHEQIFKKCPTCKGIGVLLDKKNKRSVECSQCNGKRIVKLEE